jgi:hypothetical protein
MPAHPLQHPRLPFRRQALTRHADRQLRDAGPIEPDERNRSAAEAGQNPHAVARLVEHLGQALRLGQRRLVREEADQRSSGHLHRRSERRHTTLPKISRKWTGSLNAAHETRNKSFIHKHLWKTVEIPKVLAVAMFIAACAAERPPAPTPPQVDDSRPASIGILAGDGQTATVAVTVPVSPAVIITDVKNRPVAGVLVTFSVTAGGGNANGGSVATDANGRAQLGSWVLGRVAGRQSLAATSTGGLGVVFNARAMPGSPASMAIVAGDNQGAPRGAQLSIPLSVRLRDAYDNGIAGITVLFQPSNANGTATPLVATTDSTGLAGGVRWRLEPACPSPTNAYTYLVARAGSLLATFRASILC